MPIPLCAVLKAAPLLFLLASCSAGKSGSGPVEPENSAQEPAQSSALYQLGHDGLPQDWQRNPTVGRHTLYMVAETPRPGPSCGEAAGGAKCPGTTLAFSEEPSDGKTWSSDLRSVIFPDSRPPLQAGRFYRFMSREYELADHSVMLVSTDQKPELLQGPAECTHLTELFDRRLARAINACSTSQECEYVPEGIPGGPCEKVADLETVERLRAILRVFQARCKTEMKCGFKTHFPVCSQGRCLSVTISDIPFG